MYVCMYVCTYVYTYMYEHVYIIMYVHEHTILGCMMYYIFQFPDRHKVKEFLEPVVNGTLIFPDQYLGKILQLCEVRVRR